VFTGNVSKGGRAEGGGLEAGCRPTLYFSRSSLLRGALMMLRRMLEGASKCALRDLRREEWRSARGTSLVFRLCQWKLHHALAAVAHVLELTLAILMDFCREDWR